MRTVRVALTTGTGFMSDASIEMSTEVILETEADAEQEGEEAMVCLLAISRGMAKVEP